MGDKPSSAATARANLACIFCEGTGTVLVEGQDGHCPRCNGSGWSINTREDIALTLDAFAAERVKAMFSVSREYTDRWDVLVRWPTASNSIYDREQRRPVASFGSLEAAMAAIRLATEPK